MYVVRKLSLIYKCGGGGGGGGGGGSVWGGWQSQNDINETAELVPTSRPLDQTDSPAPPPPPPPPPLPPALFFYTAVNDFYRWLTRVIDSTDSWADRKSVDESREQHFESESSKLSSKLHEMAQLSVTYTCTGSRLSKQRMSAQL